MARSSMVIAWLADTGRTSAAIELAGSEMTEADARRIRRIRARNIPTPPADG